MDSKNKYRILIWIVVILAATNLSMGLSFWYHKQQDKKAAIKAEETIEMPSEQRTRFFREQLNLKIDQMDTFRDLNRNYNRDARQISFQLESVRLEMVQEMGRENPSQKTLENITENFGKLHTDLKELTIKYYLDMKEVCDESQQKRLNEIFISMSKTKEDVSLPHRGRRNRGNRNNL